MPLESRAFNIRDLRELAKRRLPKGIFEFIDRGAEDEVALRHNSHAFEQIKLQPRVLVDVSHRNQEIELFGKKLNMPAIIAPMGVAGMLWHQGEIALARAAFHSGIPFTLGMGSTTAMERIAENVPDGRLWFQLYISDDITSSLQVIERVKASGFEALIVTVDRANMANREYNLRNGYPMPLKPFAFTSGNVLDVLRSPQWLFGVFLRHLLSDGMPRFENFPKEARTSLTKKTPNRFTQGNSSTWDSLRILRKSWPHPLIVKGILHPQDALLAVESGADAIVISNHGGRTIDSAVAPIDVLPQVVAAVKQRIPVLIDSGFRRGSDIIKALALGARAVLLGRSILYGVAADGENGARHAINLLHAEVDRTLAMLGCPTISVLQEGYVRKE